MQTYDTRCVTQPHAKKNDAESFSFRNHLAPMVIKGHWVKQTSCRMCGGQGSVILYKFKHNLIYFFHWQKRNKIAFTHHVFHKLTFISTGRPMLITTSFLLFDSSACRKLVRCFFGNYSILIFFLNAKLPSQPSRLDIWNFISEILYHLWSDMFLEFTHKKNYCVRT